jgi:capsular exopolysaccharide synthesis family protein
MVKTPTLKTAEDVARATQLPILGCMPVVKEITTPSLVAAHQPMSPISEAFRTIFANVCGSPTDGPLRTLIITSPQAGEGKTKLLANLGIVMAQAGNSVVLVDTNLRHPLLHKEFDLPNREGLTDALLQDEPEPGPLLQATQVANLRVLSSGPLSPDTPQLLGSQKMRRLIARLKNEADFILFDTLPILPVTDAAVWAIETDGVLLVVMARRTRRLALQRAVDRLLSLGIDVVGVVLNRRPVRLMET